MTKKTIALSFLFLLTVSQARADMLAPQPPEHNPHPPQTQEEKARVNFAEKAVELQLQKEWSLRLFSSKKYRPDFQSKDLNCLQTPSCYEKDRAYIQEVLQLSIHFGP